jgi:ATP-dependent DNA helicase RecG
MKESQNIEFKQSWHDDYLKWICGFANASGGKLLIGVNDAGEVIGIRNFTTLMEDVPSKVRNLMG